MRPVVDAFGYPSLPLRGIMEAFGDIAGAAPPLLDAPVWVGINGFYRPVRNVIVNAQRRTIIQVHDG